MGFFFFFVKFKLQHRPKLPETSLSSQYIVSFLFSLHITIYNIIYLEMTTVPKMQAMHALQCYVSCEDAAACDDWNA